MRDEAMEIAREYCGFYGLAPLNFELIVTDLSHFQADKDAVDQILLNGLDAGDWLQRGRIAGMTLHDAAMERFYILLIRERVGTPRALRRVMLHETAHVHSLPRVRYDARSSRNALVNHGFYAWAEFIAQRLMLNLMPEAAGAGDFWALKEMIAKKSPPHPRIAAARIGYYLANLSLHGADYMDCDFDLGGLDPHGKIGRALGALYELTGELYERGFEEVRYGDLRKYGLRTLGVLEAMKE